MRKPRAERSAALGTVAYGSIGSPALGEPFGPNPGGFRGRYASHKQDPWGTGIEKGRTLNLPASGPCAEKKPIRLVYASILEKRLDMVYLPKSSTAADRSFLGKSIPSLFAISSKPRSFLNGSISSWKFFNRTFCHDELLS